eukprot:TRINITY_DN1112_c1_g2_i2.p1 TRINITY_DN1112_c1_g2~~TRINITY_DN1112_c1_g2_i2.p1  ORF type:complete len:120 (-),score=4.36 TRINITY_DN1112_c1_g2_i2:42-401(-)
MLTNGVIYSVAENGWFDDHESSSSGRPILYYDNKKNAFCAAATLQAKAIIAVAGDDDILIRSVKLVLRDNEFHWQTKLRQLICLSKGPSAFDPAFMRYSVEEHSVHRNVESSKLEVPFL